MARKGGLREKATLLYEQEVYTPEGAKSLTNKELRKEYSRLRSIARKRLERFEGTEWTDTQVYKLNAGVYKPLKEIKSDRELRHLLTAVSRFIMAETGSVSGLEKQRATAVATLNERGYDFVNKENYREFAEFMEYARVSNLNRMYDSKRIAEFFNEMHERKQMTEEELRKAFRSWSRKQKKQRKIQNQNPRTSRMYRQEGDELPSRSQQQMQEKQRLEKEWRTGDKKRKGRGKK